MKIFKFLKPKKIDFEPRFKTKGKSKTGRLEARKKSVKMAALKVILNENLQLFQDKIKILKF